MSPCSPCDSKAGPASCPQVESNSVSPDDLNAGHIQCSPNQPRVPKSQTRISSLFPKWTPHTNPQIMN